MENFKNELCSEFLRIGFTPEQAVRALSAVAITLKGYTVTRKESNIVQYDANDVTKRLIHLFVDCKRVEGCSNGYCNNLSIVLPKLFGYVGKGVKEVNSFDIRGFLAWWQTERNVSGATLDKYRMMINQFYVWLLNEGAISHNPCTSIKKIKGEIKQRESLSQLEMETIRQSLKDSREKLLIEFLYSTGCRASELCSVKVTDINLDDGTVVLFGKGKKQRTGYLNARATIAIRDYLKNRGFDSEYLFCNLRAPHGKIKYTTIEKLINVIGERVGDQIHHKLHPHLFRHTTATHSLCNGMPINEVQMLLGHSSVATTQIYAETSASQLKQNHIRCVV